MRIRSASPWGRRAGALMLGLFVFITLFPLWIALKTALTPEDAVFGTAKNLLPRDVTLMNFVRVLFPDAAAGGTGGKGRQGINFGLALRNSVIFTVLVVTGQVFFSAMAAYAFARIRFFGRDALFFMMICAMMIPGVVLFIPNFILIKEIGWLNTFAGMVAPYVLMSPFSVFFLRQFFLSTPVETEEAARIDGASHGAVFLRIVLPLHRGALATLIILTSIGTWNDFFWPFLVGYDEDTRVMSVAVNAFREQTMSSVPDWSGLMAATILSIVPVVALLAFFGRRVVESFQFSGMR